MGKHNKHKEETNTVSNHITKYLEKPSKGTLFDGRYALKVTDGRMFSLINILGDEDLTGDYFSEIFSEEYLKECPAIYVNEETAWIYVMDLGKFVASVQNNALAVCRRIKNAPELGLDMLIQSYSFSKAKKLANVNLLMDRVLELHSKSKGYSKSHPTPLCVTLPIGEDGNIIVNPDSDSPYKLEICWDMTQEELDELYEDGTYQTELCKFFDEEAWPQYVYFVADHCKRF